ncbi:MAG TPA: hypothetical protein VGX71_25140 [Pseudaminobacter sp.]|nr:hypothetical protein [Pseudaminobacter sp.]
MMLWLRRLFALFAVLAATAARAEGPVLMIDDPAILSTLGQRGYGFAGLFGVEDDGDLETLYRDAPAYRAIVEVIEADVAALRSEMQAGGRTLYEVTDGNVGRIMDMRWLKTNAARFRLVGIVNRLDRRDFSALRGRADCGEVRFVYRLAYSFRKKGKGKQLSSRMPFNFNAVYSVLPDADGGCTGVALRWTPEIDETADAGWLAGGSLDPSELAFRQLELNAQVVRFPSGQETEFGGQAAYLMRIFGIDGETVTELPLENTPDAARLASDAALKAKLAGYVVENAPAIDRGVYKIPVEFLARKVVSYSTFGSVRQANHPFAPLFQPEEFSELDFSGMHLLRSAQALIERLDNGSCQGCPPGGIDCRLSFHRPRRQIDVAAEPPAGRHLAASPRRACAARGLYRRGR